MWWYHYEASVLTFMYQGGLGQFSRIKLVLTGGEGDKIKSILWVYSWVLNNAGVTDDF